MENKMKRVIITVCLMAASSVALADSNVRGYTRSDGTYVQPHIRSSPDSSKANNYGPKSSGSSSLYNRDNDKDGSSNQNDSDDNNNGIGDNKDRSQYRMKP